MNEFVNLYEAYLLEEKHASANTVASYIRDIKQFDIFVYQFLSYDINIS